MSSNYRIINADVLEGLKGLPDNSVHCCVCSPPYYNLRDYLTAEWVDGDPGCDHKNYGSAPQGKSDSHSPDQPARQGGA